VIKAINSAPAIPNSPVKLHLIAAPASAWENGGKPTLKSNTRLINRPSRPGRQQRAFPRPGRGGDQDKLMVGAQGSVQALLKPRAWDLVLRDQRKKRFRRQEREFHG
jgi:hypothetical protein